MEKNNYKVRLALVDKKNTLDSLCYGDSVDRYMDRYRDLEEAEKSGLNTCQKRANN